MTIDDKIIEAAKEVQSLIDETNRDVILIITETIDESLGEDYETEVYTNDDLVTDKNSVINISLKKEKELFSYEIHTATEDVESAIESAIDLIVERHTTGK